MCPSGCLSWWIVKCGFEKQPRIQKDQILVQFEGWKSKLPKRFSCQELWSKNINCKNALYFWIVIIGSKNTK